MSELKQQTKSPAFRYVCPFLIFILLTELQRFADGKEVFFVYALKSVLTAAALYYFFRGRLKEISGGFSFEAVIVGVVSFFVWLGLTEIIPHEKVITFNPYLCEDKFFVYAAMAIRIAGASLVVPLMEELIWRSFLMRYLIDSNFLSINIGKYTHFSFWGTVIAFTLVHAQWEWLAAFAVGIIYGGYVVYRKNIWGVIIAHGVTNLLLGLYVIYTGKYYYW